MDIVVLFNGLGNQMSQYAFYLAKKAQNPNCLVIFDTNSSNNHNGFELGKLFGINCDKGFKHRILEFLYRVARTERLNKIRKYLGNLRLNIVYEARNYDFNPKLLMPGNDVCLNFYWGGWHSEKNFLIVEKEVRRSFVFPPIVDSDCLRIEGMIKNTKESVSLHVRRGDYLNSSPDDYYQFGGVATIDYYQKAISYIRERVSDAVFFVFSNDLDWCKQNMLEMNAIFVGCNSGENSWRDMYLMTICKHHINANSSFSWWGAWLSNKNGITICPKRFIRTVVTKDIYPEKWIRL